MKKITLSDITQEDFDEAADAVSSGIKAYNRKLDTRAGTVLRDLLVDPEAAIESVTAGQIEEARKSSSLVRLKEAQDAGDEIDQEDVSAILSNFNIKPHAGTPAKGLVKIVVSDGTVAYSISQGATMSTVDEVEFTVDSQVIAASDAFSNPGLSPTTKLYEGAAGYFFLVPVTAAEPGSNGNIQQGTSLTPESAIPSFVMAEAYKDFCGGSDVQSLGSVIDSIPTGLSIRGFVNKNAVEGMFRDEFDDGENPIVAVSAVGYGNPAQRRDKHNLFGVGVGGRVDVYVRNFSDIFTSTKTLKASDKFTYEDDAGQTQVGYYIDVPPGTFPGSCWIKSVFDPFSVSVDDESEAGNVLESLAFEAERTADASGTWHDFDRSTPGKEAVSAFNTVWQGFRIKVLDAPPDIGAEDSSSGNDDWSEEREFSVTAFCIPQAEELQAYVDRDDVRSVATDVVVRCPIVCNVSVNAEIRYDPKKPVDETDAKERIRSYINGLGFVGRLTRSEIVQLLKNLGAVSVEMPSKNMLYGELHDATGARHVLSGDALDVSTIEDGAAMLTKDTVVFCAQERNVQLKLTPNS